MKICIILVNYNGSEDTIECVETIKKNIQMDYRIVVVDNASTDNSYQKI